MTTVAAVPEPPVRRSALANFAAVGIRPRATMRRILDAGRDRMIIPLVLLAMISGILGDADRPSLAAIPAENRLQFGLIVCAAVLGILLLGLLFFYLFSWAMFAIGRVLEGQGTAREVRSSAAWGLVPIIWALLYRIPAVIWFPATTTRIDTPTAKLTFNPPMAGQGCVTAMIFGALELAVLIWFLFVISNTIGEAHRFSGWRGLGTLLLTAATPIIIVIAAVLAA